MEFNYKDAFNRNIGVVDKLEQELISKAKISLAGVGGIGGSTLLTLVRMGFQNFKIADLDTFDMANSNRQAGANLKTYNRAKVEVMREMALSINPSCEISVYPIGVTEENADEFVEDSDVVVDCIDFFCMNAREILHSAAKRHHKHIFLSAPMGLSATVIGFSPSSMSYTSYFDFREDDDPYTKLLKLLIGLAPKATHAQYVDFSVERISKMKTGPSIANAVSLGVALITNEVLMAIIKKREPLCAPKSLQIDLYRQKYELSTLSFGNRGPLQRLKLLFAKEKYKSARHEFLEFIK